MKAADMDFIDPPRRERTVDGRALVIEPLRARMIPRVLQLLNPVLDDIGLLMLDQAMWDRWAAGRPDVADLAQIAELLGKRGDALLDALALLTRQDQAWVDELLPDRLAFILGDVFWVNRDFFQRAMPLLQALFQPQAAQVQSSEGQAGR